jgi:hypothetical protein
MLNEVKHLEVKHLVAGAAKEEITLRTPAHLLCDKWLTE